MGEYERTFYFVYFHFFVRHWIDEFNVWKKTIIMQIEKSRSTKSMYTHSSIFSYFNLFIVLLSNKPRGVHRTRKSSHYHFFAVSRRQHHRERMYECTNYRHLLIMRSFFLFVFVLLSYFSFSFFYASIEREKQSFLSIFCCIQRFLEITFNYDERIKILALKLCFDI